MHYKPKARGFAKQHAIEPKPTLVSLVVPVLNERDSIKVFTDQVEKVFATLTLPVDYEILFINDGSVDATEFVIRSLSKENPRIRLVNLSRNFGKEAALCAGLKHAQGDAVIPMDVDLQDPPEVVPEMIEKWLKGATVVNACRATRNGDTWSKKATAGAFYKMFNMVAAQPIPENVGDFRLMDRQVVDVICELGEHARFNKSLFSWVGFEAATVNFERPERSVGKSKWSYWKLWNFALDGIFSSSTAPLRIWTYIGGMAAFAAFSYAAFILILTLFTGNSTPGYASTVIMILGFGGLNLFALGIIGEYIGRIYDEVRGRPLYVVRSLHGIEEDS
ncbi:MAG: glycosyltransferase family 2 protein [Paracoccaceae bacterium]